MSDSDRSLTVYGAPWCPHCKRVKRFLAAHRVAYDNVDIDDHAETIRADVEALRGSPFLPAEVDIRGFIYDVRTGRLTPV